MLRESLLAQSQELTLESSLLRTDNLPKRSVGCPGLKLVSVLRVVVAVHGHCGVKNPIQQCKTVRPCLTL